MNRAAMPVFFFAALLTALTIVLYFWSESDWLGWGTFAVATTAAWVLGVLASWPRRRLTDRRAAGASPSTIVIALGLAVALIGAVGGYWLTLIGAGAVVFGLAGVVAERR